MTPEPAPDLVQLLEESQADLNDAVSTVGDAVPAAGGWSVVECLEHLVFSEERFLGRLAAAQRQEVAGDNRTAELSGKVIDRSNHVQAPEIAHPKGRFSTAGEALDAFNAARTRSIEMARDHAADLPFLSLEHQRFGTVTGVGAMVLLAGHARRHAAQIRQIQS